MKIKMIIAAFLALSASALAMPSPTAQANDSVAPQLPDGVQVLRAEQAQGFQIYTCQGTFQRPYAELTGEIVHYGPGGAFPTDIPGPRWETYGGQGFSRVIGSVAPGGAFPNADPGSNIPDLLLNVIAVEGDGPLAQATNILRLNTTGGTFPQGDFFCDQNNEVWVPYTATYVFGYRP
jgi:hypothetical protein